MIAVALHADTRHRCDVVLTNPPQHPVAIVAAADSLPHVANGKLVQNSPILTILTAPPADAARLMALALWWPRRSVEQRTG